METKNEDMVCERGSLGNGTALEVMDMSKCISNPSPWSRKSKAPV